MSDVFANLIEPLEERFDWKGMTNEQEMAAKADMIRSFKHYSDDVLRRAAQWIRENRKFSSMPTVGDIREVIERIVAERRREVGDIPFADEKGNGWRISAKGTRYYRIERGTKEWVAWMAHYRSSGKKSLADFLDRRDDPHFVTTQWPPVFTGDEMRPDSQPQ